MSLNRTNQPTTSSRVLLGNSVVEFVSLYLMSNFESHKGWRLQWLKQCNNNNQDKDKSVYDDDDDNLMILKII